MRVFFQNTSQCAAQFNCTSVFLRQGVIPVTVQSFIFFSLRLPGMCCGKEIVSLGEYSWTGGVQPELLMQLSGFL